MITHWRPFVYASQRRDVATLSNQTACGQWIGDVTSWSADDAYADSVTCGACLATAEHKRALEACLVGRVVRDVQEALR